MFSSSCLRSHPIRCWRRDVRSNVSRYSAQTVGVRTDPYLRSEVKYGRHLAYFKINIASNSISSKSESYAFFIKI